MCKRENVPAGPAITPWDLNTRETRSVALNVFEKFLARFAGAYRQDRFRLARQHFAQTAITMCSIKWRNRALSSLIRWICGFTLARPALDALLPRVDLRILNDSEAREMTKENSLIKAGPESIRGFGPSLRRDQERRAWCAAIWRGRRILQLRCLSAGRHSRAELGRGHLRRGGIAGYLAGKVKDEVRFPASARRHDLR